MRSHGLMRVPAVPSFVLALLLATVPAAQLDAGGVDDRVDDADSRVPIVLEGSVVGPDGVPADGAIVVSSAGGRAITDADGRFWLETIVPRETANLQVTAVGRGGTNLVASASVALPGGSSPAMVPLRLSGGTPCQATWLPTFGGRPGVNGTVNALAVYDDGSGPALYVGGEFTIAGGVKALNLAKWDGVRWSAIVTEGAGGNYNRVRALCVFDDGSGPALYVSGFGPYIFKWDGTSRVFISSFNGTANALTVFDDGSGPALYAGGQFHHNTYHVEKWNGTSWVSLGGGMDNTVNALAVFDDGNGPALYAVGKFATAGGVPANRVARWDGTSWSALGSGLGIYTSDDAKALTVFDDGNGPALYAGGSFTTAGGVAAANVAKWDGTAWSALGSGHMYRVWSLAVYDDGSGPALIAGGDISARWDGSTWSNIDVNGVFALTLFDDGSGPALYMGGNFRKAGDEVVNDIAKWDGASFGGVGSGLTEYVTALTVYDDGGGPALYAAVNSNLCSTSTPEPARVLRWDGTNWTPLREIANSCHSIQALAVYDDGSGPGLYVGGYFTDGGGVNHIAKWDGTGWGSLAGGMDKEVKALTVFDDGSGPALYAGGRFLTAGGFGASGVAKWDGASWSSLGSGVDVSGDAVVTAMTVFDDGGGPKLYVGGDFHAAGGVAARDIARWDGNGTGWSRLGSGVDGKLWAMTVFDDGNGPALYVGGNLVSAGGLSVNDVAKWDGVSWARLGSGIGGCVNSWECYVQSLGVFDDGNGPELYAGGDFTDAGGVPVNGMARWDGTRWAPVGGGVLPNSSTVRALMEFNDGSGPALFAGGGFLATDSGDSYLAKWGCVDLTPPVLSCPQAVHAIDRINSPPGENVFFTVTATDNADSAPTLVCVPPSGSFFPRGTTLVTCTSVDAGGNVSTCQFPVTVQVQIRRR